MNKNDESIKSIGCVCVHICIRKCAYVCFSMLTIDIYLFFRIIIVSQNTHEDKYCLAKLQFIEDWKYKFCPLPFPNYYTHDRGGGGELKTQGTLYTHTYMHSCM